MENRYTGFSKTYSAEEYERLSQNLKNRIEAEYLAKLVNRRLKYAEANGTKIMKEYDDVLQLISMSGRGSNKKGNRFKENLGYVDDKYIAEFLPKLRRASTFTSFSGKEAKKKLEKTYDDFFGHFEDKVTKDDVNDYLEFKKSESFKIIEQYLSSSQIMDITQSTSGKQQSLSSMIEEYMASNRGQEFNPRDFISYVYNY